MNATANPQFPSIRFGGTLRPSQAEVAEIARAKLSTGSRKLHIVAPPGSGKTVLGLYLWAECIRTPALVLSPNSAIQAQWAARTDLFEMPADNCTVSTDPGSPGLLTSLTYQSVTLPKRGDAELEDRAIDLWVERLIDKEQAHDPSEALVWIEDLERHNPDYYNRRLSAYRKEVRDNDALEGNAMATLHESSQQTLERLRDRGVGLIILDECHHLMGHWGRVLAGAQEFLNDPIIIGLTATPPDQDGKHPIDIERYNNYFGPCDYEIPVPAVVRDGFLAPYQDLSWFVRPTAEELKFIASADQQFEDIVAELCSERVPEIDPLQQSADGSISGLPEATQNHTPSDVLTTIAGSVDSIDISQIPPTATPVAPRVAPMQQWLYDTLDHLRLPTGPVGDWSKFERRDPEFSKAARIYLLQTVGELPPSVPEPASELSLADIPWMQILTPVIDRYIRHGLRRSPNAFDHVLAQKAVQRLRILGVQITETGCQPCASPVGRVMAYSSSKCDALIPVLTAESEKLGDSIRAVVVTDYEKTSAVTSEIAHLLDAEAGGAIAAFKRLLTDPVTNDLDPVLITGSTVLIDSDLSITLLAAANEWLQRHKFQVVLSLKPQQGFQELNGQGGDWCPRVYVAMITDLFQQGLTRCLIGTRGLLGEGWDANKINVLIDLTSVTTSMTVNQLRGRSIRLDPAVPDKLANNWDVVCIAPEFTRGLDDYHRFIRKHKTIYGVTDDGAIEKGVGHVHAAFTEIKPEGIEGSLSALNADMLQRSSRRAAARELWKIGQPYSGKPIRAVEVRPSTGEPNMMPPFANYKSPWSSRSLAMAVGEATLAALYECKLIDGAWGLKINDRSGGYVRVFLENAPEEDSEVFSEALRDAFGAINNPRYVIERHVDEVTHRFFSQMLPHVVGRYLAKRTRKLTMLHAVPTALAKKRELVDVYVKHWNRLVSPGEAHFARKGKGEELLDTARRGKLVPPGWVHEKEIFM